VVSDAQVLRGKYVVESFTDDLHEKYGARLLFGADWGFSSDPTTLIRCFMVADTLYVSHEAYQHRADLDRIQDVFDPVPDARRCRIYADNAQPGVIGLAQKRGFDVLPADKWQGSIADGVAFLRQLKRIVIHPRCTHVIEEARLWSYKLDPKTNEPMPDLKSGWDHMWDAARYALTGGGYIRKDDAGARAVRQFERMGKFEIGEGLSRVPTAETAEIAQAEGHEIPDVIEGVAGAPPVELEHRPINRADLAVYREMLRGYLPGEGEIEESPEQIAGREQAQRDAQHQAGTDALAAAQKAAGDVFVLAEGEGFAITVQDRMNLRLIPQNPSRAAVPPSHALANAVRVNKVAVLKVLNPRQ
jgi:hypothetical protein